MIFLKIMSNTSRNEKHSYLNLEDIKAITISPDETAIHFITKNDEIINHYLAEGDGTPSHIIEQILNHDDTDNILIDVDSL